MREQDRAWAACAIDSEGVITSSRCGNRRYHTCPHPRLELANTNRQYMEKFCNIFNLGHDRIKRYRNGSNGWIYKVQVCSMKNIARILQEIHPYLIIKRQRAERTVGRCIM